MINTPTPTEILLTRLEKNDADASTIGQFLAKLTQTIWIEEESFSGKRPFGNSDWKDPIIHALILNAYLEGELDEYGYIEDYDYSQFTVLMDSVFELLNNADYATLSLPPEAKNFRLICLSYENGLPEIADYYCAPMTKEVAEKTLKDIEDEGNADGWIIYHQKQ